MIIQTTKNEKDSISTLEEVMTDLVHEDYAAIRKARQRMICHRTASAGVALSYVIFFLFQGNGHAVVKVALFLVLPLAAIWFSDELGSLTGVRFGRFAGPAVTDASPGVFVRIAGWILLLSPAIAAVISGVLW